MKGSKGINHRIQLNDVTKFASGTYGRGKKQKFVLWAFGKTGWFEIHPSPKYRAVYDEMMQGVKLFYFLCDQYTIRPHQRRPLPQQIFKAFAATPRSNCADAHAVQELLYKHHYFLLSEMIKDTQGIGWEKTPIFRNLSAAFPDATQNIRLRILDSDIEQEEEAEEEAEESQSPLSDQAESSEDEPHGIKIQSPKLPPVTDPVLYTPKGKGRRTRARPRQSVLRPTSSRSVKSSKKRGKAPIISDGESDDVDDDGETGTLDGVHDTGLGNSDDNDEENEDTNDNDDGDNMGTSEGAEDDEDDEPVENGDNMSSDDSASSEKTLNSFQTDRHTYSPLNEDTINTEERGVVMAERINVVQSEGSRGARISHLLEFVMNRPSRDNCP